LHTVWYKDATWDSERTTTARRLSAYNVLVSTVITTTSSLFENDNNLMDKANDLDKTAWPHPHFCQYCHSVDFDAVYHVLSLHATLRVPLRTTVTWSRVRSTKNADSPLPIRFQICPSLLHATLTLPAPSPLIATELTLVEVKSRSANQLNNEWLTSPRASLSIHLSLTHTTLFTFWKGSTIIRKKNRDTAAI